MKLVAGALLLFTVVLSNGCIASRNFCDGCSGCSTANSCGCDDCGQRPIPNGPLEELQIMRRSLICGGGCGEVYYGEWLSTPPDCCDPCDGCNQWVGGDGCKCLPFVRFRGFLTGLLGQRFHSDETPGLLDCGPWSSDICRNNDSGCGEGGCEVSTDSAPASGGCSVCAALHNATSGSIRTSLSTGQRLNMSNQTAQGQPTASTPAIPVRR